MRLGFATEDRRKPVALRTVHAQHDLGFATTDHDKPFVFKPDKVLDRLGFTTTPISNKPPPRRKPRFPEVSFWTAVQVFKHAKGWVAYYGSVGSSFGIVTNSHVDALRGIGWKPEYQLRRHDQMKHRWKGRSGWGLVHPVFHVTRHRLALGLLRMVHEKVGGFDLADSDHLTGAAVNTANRMDLVMVPSRCSLDAYRRSGVRTRVEVVPHGLSKHFSLPPKLSPHIPAEGVSILFFIWHSHHRKGADVVYTAMKRILEEREDVRLVVKGTDHRLEGLPRTVTIRRWFSEQELVQIYDSCQIVLVPSRGGGFEINALEALARGRILITSEWPAITEYAAGKALIIRNTGNKVKPLPGNPIHDGYGADPDPQHLYEQINQAIDNREALLKQAAQRAPAIREAYTWRNTATRIAKCLS